MNILFVSSDNNLYSGAFQCMAKLAELLQQEYGHKILVVLPYEGSGKHLLDEKGINSILITSYDWTVKFADRRKITKWVKHLVKVIINRCAIYRIAKIISKEEIDLVHINTSWGYVGAVAAVKCNIPFIWQIQEFLEEDQDRQIWNKDKGYKLMRKATDVVAISESVYEKYLSIIGKEHLVKILDGIDSKGYYCSEHNAFSSSDIQMLIIGGINESKGQYIAINACLRILQLGVKNFKLRIVGKGNQTYIKELMEVVKKANAQDYIEYCGPTEDATKYYQTSDIVLMCSRSEAFGRVTVEAMYAGALVIGADTAGTKELIQDGTTGLLFESGHAMDLADRIIYAINHKEEMREIAKAGQNYMLQNMTAEINAKNFNDLYNNIINQK